MFMRLMIHMKRARAWEVQVISKPHSTLLRVWLVGFNSDRRHHISGVHVCLAGRCLCSCCDRVQSQGTPLHEPKPSSAPARYTCFCGAAWPRYACFTARCEFIITHTSAHNPGTITLVHTAPHKRAYDFAINRLAKMRRHSNAPLTPWAQSGCCSNNNNKIKNKHGYAGQLNSCTHLRALLVLRDCGIFWPRQLASLMGGSVSRWDDLRGPESTGKPFPVSDVTFAG